MSDLLSDLKFAVRGLLRDPGFTVVALVILALGIGANTAIFSFVNGVMLRPLPYPEADRLVVLLSRPPQGYYARASTLNYLDWEKQATAFEAITADNQISLTLVRKDKPVQVKAWEVRANFFDLYRTRPMFGRTFRPGEDEPGNNRVVVLTYSFWASQFGSDARIVGQTIPLNGEPCTVIGVLPPSGFYDRSGIQVWVPLTFTSANRTRNLTWLEVRAKLKPGVTLKQAQAQMDIIAARLAHDFPEANRDWKIAVMPLTKYLVHGELEESLYLLLATVGLVLLIACANLANLSLARGLARQREVAIRVSLGSSRGRLIRQFLTESCLLCAVGGVLGIAAAWAINTGLRLSIPPHALPAEADIRMDGRVLIFALVASIITAAVSGVVPAFHSTRIDLAGAMKQSGPNASTDRRGRRLRQFLVVTEVALTFLLLTGAGLLIRSFSHMQQVEVANDPSRVILCGLPLPNGQYRDAVSLRHYTEAIDERVRAMPGVKDVAIATNGPLGDWGPGVYVQVEGHPFVPLMNRDTCGLKVVTPSYFSTVGLRLIRGRFLLPSDNAAAAPAMVINEAFAAKFFPHENPIGQHVLIPKIELYQRTFGREISWEIVGVATGERNEPPGQQSDYPGAYVPFDQHPLEYLTLVIRTSTDPALVEQTLLHTVDSVNRDQALPGMQTLTERKTDMLGVDRLRSGLLLAFAGVALCLSALGIYGILSYSVAQRTRELGIRMALGSSAKGILSLTIREGMALVAIGLIIGLAAALNLSRLLASLLVGVGSNDPPTMILAAVILAGVGFSACYLPAKRAAQVNPQIALQAE